MSEIKTIMGLGNPGEEYFSTRHNIGYLVVDALLKKFHGEWKSGRGSFFYAPIKIGGSTVYLVRSTTYMNNSWNGAANAVEKLDILPSELLVILDDFALPFGQIRIRKSGSDGGHNGLASIIYHLATQKFPRLRIGIGPVPDDEDAINFVLDKFTPDERKFLPEIIKRSADAAIVAVKQNIGKAMEMFNKKL